jgi:DNA-binding CsgD family transcriptional regulator
MAPITAEDGSDDRRLLELVGDVCGLLDLAELRHGLIDAVGRVLPSDWLSLNDIGPGPGEVVSMLHPDADFESYESYVRFQELAHENPILQYNQRTLDGRAYRFSDLVTREQLHALALYREVYKPMGVEYQLAFTLPAGPGRVLAIALSRGERDYSDAERDLANRARPYLIQAYLNAIAFEVLRARAAGTVASLPPAETLLGAGLTPREADALRLLATGRSNHHIAAELGISHRTVGKHLERSFRKLGVSDRSSAAGRVWELAAAVRSGPVVRSAESLLPDPFALDVAEPLEHSRLARQQAEREHDGGDHRAP